MVRGGVPLMLAGPVAVSNTNCQKDEVLLRLARRTLILSLGRLMVEILRDPMYVSATIRGRDSG